MPLPTPQGQKLPGFSEKKTSARCRRTFYKDGNLRSALSNVVHTSPKNGASLNWDVV